MFNRVASAILLVVCAFQRPSPNRPRRPMHGAILGKSLAIHAETEVLQSRMERANSTLRLRILADDIDDSARPTVLC